jgi:hypothetical protein
MKGHGAKFGRKKEEAIVALPTLRNIEEAVRATGVAATADGPTLLKTMIRTRQRPEMLLLASRLASWGIERGPNESLAETTARAMGISVRELRAESQRRAGYS